MDGVSEGNADLFREFAIAFDLSFSFEKLKGIVNGVSLGDFWLVEVLSYEDFFSGLIVVSVNSFDFNRNIFEAGGWFIVIRGLKRTEFKELFSSCCPFLPG